MVTGFEEQPFSFLRFLDEELLSTTAPLIPWKKRIQIQRTLETNTQSSCVPGICNARIMYYSVVAVPANGLRRDRRGGGPPPLFLHPHAPLQAWLHFGAVRWLGMVGGPKTLVSLRGKQPHCSPPPAPAKLHLGSLPPSKKNKNGRTATVVVFWKTRL